MSQILENLRSMDHDTKRVSMYIVGVVIALVVIGFWLLYVKNVVTSFSDQTNESFSTNIEEETEVSSSITTDFGAAFGRLKESIGEGVGAFKKTKEETNDIVITPTQ